MNRIGLTILWNVASLLVASVALLPAVVTLGCTWLLARLVLWMFPVESHWSLWVLSYLVAAWIMPFGWWMQRRMGRRFDDA